MKILIVEDEEPAAKKLEAAARLWSPDVTIVGTLKSIRESVQWLTRNPPPDLIFMDIELSDGSSFEIFKRAQVRSPVIFVTAFDEHILEAFAHNGIDYLLKPVRQNRLEAALNKYANLRAHFTANYATLADGLKQPREHGRRRVLAQQGIEFVSVPIEQIAYFVSEHKLVLLVQMNRSRFVVTRSLSELESDMDPSIFFRVNRKYLAHIQSVMSFRSFEKGKLQVELNPPVEERVIVSQEKASEFRNWLAR